jgi:hypothetical protein
MAPGLTVTSGYEEESIFAVWRAVHQQAVFADPGRLPFSAAYFNWLFYASYAVPAKAAVALADDAAIPRAGRLFTAIGALVGAGALFWILRSIQPSQALLAGGMASYVYFGPLIGWWAHTIRPDVWALALETAGLGVLLLNHRRRPIVATMSSCVLFYAAWSFKQTYVLGLGTALLFLGWRRQWRLAGILALGNVMLWVLSFLMLGPSYRAALQAVTVPGIYPAIGFRNLTDALEKGAPLVLLTLALLFRQCPPSATPPSPITEDACLLGWLGLLATLPLAFAASCKLGAYSNYYFTTLTMLAILAAGLAVRCDSYKSILVGFIAAIGLLLLVATGRVGQISLEHQAQYLASVWSDWSQEPEPRFSVVNALNQPWLNPGSPPLVLAYNYPLDRLAGRQFEAGGVGGMIATGYFHSLLLPAETGNSYDGASLEHYTRNKTVKGLTVFRRIDPP